MKRTYSALLLALAASAAAQTPPPAARPPQGPNTNIYYKLAPDAMPQDGVPKGEMKGPFTLPSKAYPARSTPTGCMFRRSTTRRYPPA